MSVRTDVEATAGGAFRSRRIAVLVLGMHRSGTSALTRTLNLLGCALPRTLMAPGEGNTEGHWESQAIADFNDELLNQVGSSWDDWLPIDPGFAGSSAWPQMIERAGALLREEFGDEPLFVLKDPRICRLAPFWLEALASERIEPAIVLPLRNPLEVAHSLVKRNGSGEHYDLLLWLRHVLDAEAATRGRRRVFVTYDALLADWREVIGRIERELDVVCPGLSSLGADEVSSFLQPHLRHHAGSPVSLADDPSVSPWIAKAWTVLHAWAVNGEDGNDYFRLDEIRRALNEIGPIFALPLEEARQAQLRAAAAGRLQFDLEGLVAERDGMTRQVAEVSAAADDLRQRLADIEGMLALSEQRVAVADEALLRTEGRLRESEAREDAVWNECFELSEANRRADAAREKAERDLAAIRQSTSWRITLPLRKATTVFHVARTHPGQIPSRIAQNLGFKRPAAPSAVPQLTGKTAKGLAVPPSANGSETRDDVFCFILDAACAPEALERSIQSVLRQTDWGWELLLVTRAEEGEAVRRWLDADSRIRHVEAPDADPATIAEAATATFLVPLRGGDQIDDDYVRLALMRLREEGDTVDLLYCDEARRTSDNEMADIFFKPGWSPEHLESVNYIGRGYAIRKTLLSRLPPPVAAHRDARDYELVLAASAQARKIARVEECLYIGESHTGPMGGFFGEDSLEEARQALEAHLHRQGETRLRVESDSRLGALNVRGDGRIPATLVILTGLARRDVPGRGEILLVDHFVRSIVERTKPGPWKILVVDDGELPAETSAFLEHHGHRRISFRQDGPFSFAAKANFSVSAAEDGVVILLNDDLEVISPDWVERLSDMAARPQIGVVGAQLYFANDTIQHAGVVLGLGGAVGHVFHHADENDRDYGGFLKISRNCAAVTGAVMAMRKAVFAQLGGFDERLTIYYNDIDFCLRSLDAGLRAVQMAQVKLYHFENSSLRREQDSEGDRGLFTLKWGKILNRDPYYNRNFQIKSPTLPILMGGRDSIHSGSGHGDADDLSMRRDYNELRKRLFRDAKASMEALSSFWMGEKSAGLRERARTILELGLFDHAFYLKSYPDVAGAGNDPLWHYLVAGDSEDRQPNPFFEPRFYRKQFEGVGIGVENALFHYIRQGEADGLSASPMFNGERYKHFDSGFANWLDRPLTHYLHIGGGRTPSRETPTVQVETSRDVPGPVGGGRRRQAIKGRGGLSGIVSPVVNKVRARLKIRTRIRSWLFSSAGPGERGAAVNPVPRADGRSEWLTYEPMVRRIAEDRARRLREVRPMPVPMISLEGKDLAEVAASLEFPKEERPLVSIVVPVFNNVRLTLECLLSVSRCTDSRTPYEVIIADDASTDASRTVLPGIRNLVYVRHPENLGFLMNCNGAARHARGEFVLFLNNDVQVTQDWLAALVEAFAAHDKVGAVGPKIVYPSGHLQEAGAVVSPDGTTQLVGLNDDAGSPRYGFSRRVDYCSGASLMLRRAVFEELGGFSESLRPAYCEDLDLCLKLRERGLETWYVPQSVIAHHLSKTSDALGSTYKMRCIVTNRQKIAERWQEDIDAMNRIRLFAFYLPQFHPIPENDRWWGRGFTEWTNTARGLPQYHGHWQPRLPADLGFYDLRRPEVLVEQAALARRYGIEGFCFYYYWFGGKRLLETPIEAMLASGKPDFPFLLCWANENWTRRWDGQEAEVLMAQSHSDEDDAAVIRDLMRYFRDPRYVRVNGRPMLLIYRVELFPDFARTAAIWRELCRAEGIGEIYLAKVASFDNSGKVQEPQRVGCDAVVQFPPHGTGVPAILPAGVRNPDFEGHIFDYEESLLSSLRQPMPSAPFFPGVMPSWDNTARRMTKATVFDGATPGAFQAWLEEAIRRTREHNSGDENMVFINAWNEWAEGAQLEPDRLFGHTNLEAVRNALTAHMLTNEWP